MYKVLFFNMKNKTDFEWDDDKDRINQEKHGISFALGQFTPQFGFNVYQSHWLPSFFLKVSLSPYSIHYPLHSPRQNTLLATLASADICIFARPITQCDTVHPHFLFVFFCSYLTVKAGHSLSVPGCVYRDPTR